MEQIEIYKYHTTIIKVQDVCRRPVSLDCIKRHLSRLPDYITNFVYNQMRKKR